MDPEALIKSAFLEREELVGSFFATEAPRLSLLCHAMARRFIRGGRLLAFGVGAAATDAQHISVEFVHPVIVGKRALPALALPNDAPSTLGLISQGREDFFARQLAILGSPEDIAIGMTHGAQDAGAESVAAGLKQAGATGMLTVSLGGPEGEGRDADFAFAVSSEDPFVVQEIHETLYHVLWELVHVFFEHKGLLDDRPESRGHDTGRSSFLYPFLADAERDLDGVLGQVGASILNKGDDVIAMRKASVRADELLRSGQMISERMAAGGKILAFGNGGSATDAQDLVVDLLSPPPGMSAVPALSLTNDAAVVTAVGNDVGFDNIFARQIIAHGDADDVAVAISTSGGSRNVIAAVEEAKDRGLLTVGLAGYGGGKLTELCDRGHSVDADYIPRIQEAQASLYHVIRMLIDPSD